MVDRRFWSNSLPNAAEASLAMSTMTIEPSSAHANHRISVRMSAKPKRVVKAKTRKIKMKKGTDNTAKVLAMISISRVCQHTSTLARCGVPDTGLMLTCAPANKPRWTLMSQRRFLGSFSCFSTAMRYPADGEYCRRKRAAMASAYCPNRMGLSSEGFGKPVSKLGSDMVFAVSLDVFAADRLFAELAVQRNVTPHHLQGAPLEPHALLLVELQVEVVFVLLTIRDAGGFAAGHPNAPESQHAVIDAARLDFVQSRWRSAASDAAFGPHAVFVHRGLEAGRFRNGFGIVRLDPAALQYRILEAVLALEGFSLGVWLETSGRPEDRRAVRASCNPQTAAESRHQHEHGEHAEDAAQNPVAVIEEGRGRGAEEKRQEDALHDVLLPDRTYRLGQRRRTRWNRRIACLRKMIEQILIRGGHGRSVERGGHSLKRA